MANYIVSYDLNGTRPSHEEMDEHMGKAGWSYARVLETVWYVGTRQTLSDIYEHVGTILSKDDQILIVQCTEATWEKLLVEDAPLEQAWQANR